MFSAFFSYSTAEKRSLLSVKRRRKKNFSRQQFDGSRKNNEKRTTKSIFFLFLNSAFAVVPFRSYDFFLFSLFNAHTDRTWKNLKMYVTLHSRYVWYNLNCSEHIICAFHCFSHPYVCAIPHYIQGMLLKPPRDK
jgi:hypothetical protein